MGVGPSPRKTQPRTLIRSRFANSGMRRPAVGRFPKAEAGLRAACACLRVSTFPALRVPAFTRAEYRGGGRRRDHGATTGRAILPVRAAGRGWRRDGRTTWKWLDMAEEEITEIPKYNASSDILSSIHRRRGSKSRPEAGSQPHKKARRTHRDVQGKTSLKAGFMRRRRGVAMNSHNQKIYYSNEVCCSFEITSVRGGLFGRTANEWVSANEFARPLDQTLKDDYGSIEISVSPSANAYGEG